MKDSRRHWSRREWLTSVAAGTIGGVTAGGSALSALARAGAPEAGAAGVVPAGAGQAASSATGGPPLRRLGVQLYTVRDQMKASAAETLKAIAGIGYKEIELGRGDLARLVPLAKDVGLNPVSTHIEAWIVTGAKPAPPGAAAKPAPASVPAPAAPAAPAAPPTDDALKKTFDEIRAHGPSYAVVAYLFKGERPKDAAGWTKFAEQMNRAGKFAKNAGVTLGYHNHGFEFEKLPDGQRPLDVLLKTFDPALVQIELDVYWVGITGADPVALINQLGKGKRVPLLHLKDKDAAAPAETDEGKVARTSFKEVGSGGLDFPAILKAAASAGVSHLFVEQDQTPGDPIASLKQSYDYLSKLA
jgi:sugar phosphate isomerase/epimerase